MSLDYILKILENIQLYWCCKITHNKYTTVILDFNKCIYSESKTLQKNKENIYILLVYESIFCQGSWHIFRKSIIVLFYPRGPKWGLRR
jgi:hypothetical protein